MGAVKLREWWLSRGGQVKRMVAVTAAIIGFVSGCIGIWQWMTPVPVTISSKDLSEALRGREPCELIGARGLPCSGEGILQAASISTKMIDLFIAAGVTGNAIVKRYDGTGYTAWAQAYADGAPHAKYLIMQTIAKDGVIRSIPLPNCSNNSGNLPGMFNTNVVNGGYTCSPLAQVAQTDDDELFCAVFRADPAAKNMLSELLGASAAFWRQSREDWTTYHKGKEPGARMQACADGA